ncbi:MAG: hypothetical protein LH465_08095 [Sphingomonas bacterium]|nr:hypothetical protein [Sphingomonas bacterium]
MGEQTILIDRRFRGPPDSGNGGYVAGMLARSLGGSNVEVTLRAPPPLDTPLRLVSHDDGAELLSGDALIASAVRTIVELVVPPPPSASQAKDAEARFNGFEQHSFPGCFVCGPERGVGDGLRIFPGATGLEEEQVAGIWAPDLSLTDDGRRLVVEHVWAALDCPGYFAVREQAGVAVLGRIAASIDRMPEIGEAVIVSGWSVASEGRKHRAGTALHNCDGETLAMAIATWVTIG